MSTVTETDVQRTIVEGLRALGYEVWKTQPRGVWRKSQPHGTGIDKGVPDLLVGRQSWGCLRMALEVKGPKTPLSPEQQDLYDREMLYVCRSWEDAIASLVQFEAAWGLQRVAARVS